VTALKSTSRVLHEHGPSLKMQIRWLFVWFMNCHPPAEMTSLFSLLGS